MSRGLTVLGATGSIGRSTLDVVSRNPDRFHVHALTAHRDVDGLAALCERFRPAVAVIGHAEAAAMLERRLGLAGLKTRVEYGHERLERAAAAAEAPLVMAAIVGAAGLLPTLAAVRAGKTVLLANKEALVMSGPVFMREQARCGATLLPIDSEHNAVFQCLPANFRAGQTPNSVRRILLTASGGPFRDWPAQRLALATPEQACAHPNWNMGRKISVDSATLMNKGLEVIEAGYLFALPVEQIEVVIHRQSLIHSLVEYVDGSVLAQLGQPDMRTPIAHAMAWPDRMDSGVGPLAAAGRLDFEAPDVGRFPCLALARQAAEAGGSAPAMLNAANEVAVKRFLAGELAFDRIPLLISDVMDSLSVTPIDTLDEVLAADREARESAVRWRDVPRTAGGVAT